MKNQIIRINYIVIVSLLTIIFSIDDLMCQENSNMIAEQYKSKYMENINNKINENIVNNDKNMRVEILGWIIQHNLFYEYQKIDSKELEDRLERSR